MIQFFVVFHNKLFDNCYECIPPDILHKYFTFIAVNENIQKEYTQNKYKVINEWELSTYDKSFQELGYNENSVIYHIYANKLHIDYDWIGFFQYDMEFTKELLDQLLQIEHMKESAYFYFFRLNFEKTVFTWKGMPEDFIIQNYEEFFKTTFSKNEEYPLYNTYVITKDTYEKIMPWVTQLYEPMNSLLTKTDEYQKHPRIHIGAVFERIMGYVIANQGLSGINFNIHHNHSYKNLCY